MPFNLNISQFQDSGWKEDVVLILLGYQSNCPKDIECMQIIKTTRIVSKNKFIQIFYDFYSKFLNTEENILVLSNKNHLSF